MTGPVARLRRVSRFFGERPVLRTIDLDVSAGQILLVVGPNGAGKSTLLRILAGLMPPSEGEVDTDLAPGQVGYVGHRTLVYPKLTARANLTFWRALHGLPRDEAAVEAVLARVGLARFADEEAGVFSRGMAQRLSLARVLLTSPPLLLLDEPDSGLDPASAAWLRREIGQARAAGAAVVWVSHHVQADLPLADRVLCLVAGRASHDGPARDFDPAVLSLEAAC
jgi:heme exporter protein A